MKLIPKIIVTSITMAALTAVSADTLTLQQGLNGYTGAEDTYILSPTLLAEREGLGHSTGPFQSDTVLHLHRC